MNLFFLFILIYIDESSTNRVIMMPIIIEHKIDKSSPLEDLIDYSRDYENGTPNFKYNDFEILIILNGVNETTGASTQACRSYLPSEILFDQVNINY